MYPTEPRGTFRSRLITPLIVVSIVIVTIAVLLAQVTISNTGGTGTSGIQMNNGNPVSAGANQVSIWAWSTTGRGMITNHNFDATDRVIATWPCTTGLNVGGVVYGGTGGSGGYQKEACLTGNNTGTGVLTENASGVPAWGTVSGNTTTFATTTGTLNPGNTVTTDSNGNFTSTASPLPGSTDAMELYEEFASGNTSSLGIGSLGWTLTNVNGAAQAVSYPGSSSTFPHLGILRQTTGATSANGGTVSLSPSGNNDQLGNLGTNTNWTATYVFELGQTTNTAFRIGLADTVNLRQPNNGYFLRFDTSSPAASNLINNGLSCSTTICTVTTTAAHNMLLIGQSVLIANSTGCSTGRNGSHTVATIPSTTTFTFPQAGNAENCGGNTPATSTPSADTTFKVDVRKGGNSNGVSTTETVTNTSVTADTGWHKVVISSTVAGTIVFTLDGGTPISVSTNVFNSAGVTPFETLVTDANATKTVDWDLFIFSISGLAR